MSTRKLGFALWRHRHYPHGQCQAISVQVLRSAMCFDKFLVGEDNRVSPTVDGQVERYNRPSVAGLQHYIDKHQHKWDVFIQPLTYPYNMQVHRKTGTTPLGLTLSREPPGLPTIRRVRRIARKYRNVSKAHVKLKVLESLEDHLHKARVQSGKACQQYKVNFD